VKVAVSPSVAAALAAVAEARQATGTESPALAGASFARRSAPARQVAVAAPAPKPRPAAPTQVATASGPWRVQLGAFSVRGNADRLWSQLSGRSELSGKAKVTVPAGAVTKLQAGGFASRDAAEDACRSLQHSGHECLVTR
jgi:cell division septation protein DedD